MTDPAVIVSKLNLINPQFDIDGNGQVDARADGVLLLRYMFGLRGDALIAGAVGVNPIPTRATAPLIEAYIQTLMP